MNDLELTKKIKNLIWFVDLKNNTVKSDFVHYKIIKKKDYTDLKAVWISPDVPPVASVINDIQRGAVAALKNTKN